MTRFLVASVGMWMLVSLAVPASAQACPGEAACACGHAEKQLEAGQGEKAQTAAHTTESKGTLLHEVDVLVADKCSCESAADCTCKKGKCKCKACKHKRMVAPVKGTSDALKLPTEARWEATSGVFI